MLLLQPHGGSSAPQHSAKGPLKPSKGASHGCGRDQHPPIAPYLAQIMGQADQTPFAPDVVQAHAARNGGTPAVLCSGQIRILRTVALGLSSRGSSTGGRALPRRGRPVHWRPAAALASASQRLSPCGGAPLPWAYGTHRLGTRRIALALRVSGHDIAPLPPKVVEAQGPHGGNNVQCPAHHDGLRH